MMQQQYGQTATQQLPVQQQQSQQPPMQQQFVTQQPTVTVVTQNAQPSEDKLQASALSQLRGLSIMQLVMGILCFIFGIVLVAVANGETRHYLYGLTYVGYGIWIGVYFILLGGIGLGAVNSNTACWIISTMVLNIISSCCFWLVLLSFSSIGITGAVARRCPIRCNSREATYLALNSLMLIMAIAELVISIWAAALCCGAVCRCCKGSQGHVISYNTAQMGTQQQVMMIPSVPATASYGVYTNGMQVGGQAQFSIQPVGVHQQPTAFAPPQGLPGYYSASQPPPTDNPTFEQPPPTTQPTKF